MTEESIPAKFYKGRAIAGSEQYGVTSNHNDQIAIDVAVPELRRSLTVFLFFSDATAQYSIEKLRACGWTGDDITNLVGIDKNEVDISVKYEPYNGVSKMKVDIYAGGGGRVKLDAPMDAGSKRAFAARMKPLLKGAPSGATAPAARQYPAPSRGSAPEATETGVGKDDIPF